MKKQLLKSILCVLLIILNCNLAFTQAAKPRLMVFPANVWMQAHNYTFEIDNQGKKELVMDYQKALDNDKELYAVIKKIGGIMADRGFPLEDLASKLKDIKEQSALDNMDQSADGGGIAESPRDKLLKVAKPDIVLEVTWTVNTQGPKKSISFVIAGLDAGTNKQVASADGTGEPSFTAETLVLLSEAVNAHMDKFNVQLMEHFKDLFDNGREISLDIKVWDNSPKKLNDEINAEGDELKDDIKKWVKDNTVKGRYLLANSSPNMMAFNQVRIPIYDADGAAFDADGFSTKLRKYLKKTYQLPAASEARGLGKAQVVIGGKR